MNVSFPLVRLPYYALSTFIDAVVGINQLHHLPFVLLSFLFPVAIFAQQDRLLLSPPVDFYVRKFIKDERFCGGGSKHACFTNASAQWRLVYSVSSTEGLPRCEVRCQGDISNCR